MHEIGKEEIAAITKVIESEKFMRYRGGEGGFTEQFESSVKDKLKIKHALTVNSGTNALICAAWYKNSIEFKMSGVLLFS